MRTILLAVIIWTFNLGNIAYTSEKIIKHLKDGKKLIFIRHALAPGTGDPKNFQLDDCFTQRNLSQEGIKQSKKIGLFFKNNNIKIDKVLSSEWCRCKDTAKYAFQTFKTFNALNSFYDERFAANEEKQINNLKKYIKNLDIKNNIVFVTHYVVINSLLNTGTSSGEIVISDKKFNILGTITEIY